MKSLRRKSFVALICSLIAIIFVLFGRIILPRSKAFDVEMSTFPEDVIAHKETNKIANETSSKSKDASKESFFKFSRFVDIGSLNVSHSVLDLLPSFQGMWGNLANIPLPSRESEHNLFYNLLNSGIHLYEGGIYSRHLYVLSQNGLLNPSPWISNFPISTIILIPYRKRAENLLQFLWYMHRYLSMKLDSYLLVVLEQTGIKPFNRAKLFNAGLREIGILADGKALQLDISGEKVNVSCDCFGFNDIDKLPANMRIPFKCRSPAVQLIRTSIEWNLDTGIGKEYIYYESFMGGATIIDKETLLKINGFSNTFVGWGGEDDDLRKRMKLQNITVQEEKNEIGRFYSLNHQKDAEPNPNRVKMLHSDMVKNRMETDGLKQVKYKLLKRENRLLYTLLSFEI